MRNVTFNVAPRYAPGSPARVDEATARRVAQEEREAYGYWLEGAYGARIKEKAQSEGLAGIVEERVERADAWLVTDLLTGERFVRPFEKYGEKPLAQQRRHYRLSAKYHLPLESALAARQEFIGRPE